MIDIKKSICYSENVINGDWNKLVENCSEKQNENLSLIKKCNYGTILKIDDIPDLRIELKNIYDGKTKEEMVKYSLLLGQHILEIMNMEPCSKIIECFEINKKWLNGETGKGFAKFQVARNAAGKLLNLARVEKDPIQEKIYRIMAQIANTPHVKTHALWASDYVIKLLNKLYPNNYEEIKNERKIQIELMKSV